MRDDVQLLAGDLADRAEAAPAFFGRRWALRLGMLLLVGLGLITVARWREGTASSSGLESIVQQPVPAEPFPSAARANTAPDPGDNPP